MSASFNAVGPSDRASTCIGRAVRLVLGNLLEIEGMEYSSSEEIRDEVLASSMELTANNITLDASEQRMTAGGLERIATPAPFMIDGITRRAAPLHKTADGAWAIRMNPATAAGHNLSDGDSAILKQGDGATQSTVVLDDSVPDHCVWFPSGVPGSDEIGGSCGAVSVEKAS